MATGWKIDGIHEVHYDDFPQSGAVIGSRQVDMGNSGVNVAQNLRKAGALSAMAE